VPTVKIILQHTRQIQEGEQRFRNIAKIFLENQLGERILAPTTRPGIAQVYARHLAEGGVPNDDRWNHIKGLCEEYGKMAGFVRATRGKEFNESAQPLINEGVSHYNNLRETLGKMRSHRGYNTYFESYTPTLMETEGDETLNELFVQETLDPRIESVMPILSRLRKNLGEMSEVKTLESWADSIISEKMDSTTKSLAVPADEMLDESEERPYVCVHAKKGKHECKASSSYEAAKKAAQHWGLKSTAGIDAYLADVKHTPVNEVPGAETLSHNQNTEKSNLKAFDLAEQNQPEQKLADALKKIEAKIAAEKNLDVKTKLLAKKTEIETALKQLKSQPASTSTVEPTAFSKIKKPNEVEPAGGKERDPADLALSLIKLGAGLSEDDAEDAHKKVQTPAYLRKAKGDDWKTTTQDLEKAKERNISGKEGLDALKKNTGIEEGMTKHKMHADAEKMSLEEFCDKYGDEDWIKEFWRDSNGVEEGLDANQKRAGQLGPTEKVGPKGAVGKLVGANESVDPLLDLKRLLGK